MLIKCFREHGLESEIDYPYEMINNHCRINTTLSRVTIHDYVDIEPNNETALLIAVATIGLPTLNRIQFKITDKVDFRSSFSGF